MGPVDPLATISNTGDGCRVRRFFKKTRPPLGPRKWTESSSSPLVQPSMEWRLHALRMWLERLWGNGHNFHIIIVGGAPHSSISWLGWGHPCSSRGGPIEDPTHGFLAMAFFRWPSSRVSLFLAASQNLLIETFLMPRR